MWGLVRYQPWFSIILDFWWLLDVWYFSIFSHVLLSGWSIQLSHHASAFSVISLKAKETKSDHGLASNQHHHYRKKANKSLHTKVLVLASNLSATNSRSFFCLSLSALFVCVCVCVAFPCLCDNCNSSNQDTSHCRSGFIGQRLKAACGQSDIYGSTIGALRRFVCTKGCTAVACAKV